MTARANITGQRFGSLMALSFLCTKNQASVWVFACNCGTFLTREAKAVRHSYSSGRAVSCGCVALEVRAENGRQNKTHGFSGTKLYDVHRQMLQRCYNEACKDFPAYGARGIAVCDAWHNIHTFMDWCALSGYREGLTIERKDVNGNYEPNNCTWIENERQAHNTRRLHNLTINGETYFVSEWARRVGISRNTIMMRLRLGWSVADAVMTPVGMRGAV